MSAQTVLITGVSSGIGLEVALTLARKGYNVVGGSRTPPPYPHIKWHRLDLSDFSSIENFVNAVRKENPAIDVLINNAGIGVTGPVEDLTPEIIEKVLRVNLTGAIHLTSLLLKDTILPGGKVINIASIGGVIPLPYRGIYSASKAALISVSLAMHMELKKRGIQVCCVLPGDVSTSINERRLFPEKISPIYADYPEVLKKIDEEMRGGVSPQMVAQDILTLVEKKKMPAIKITGKTMQKIYYVLWHIIPVRLALLMVERHYWGR